MAVLMSVALRNARLDALETSIGTSPTLWIYGADGTIPSSCAAGDGTSTVLVNAMSLGSGWMDDAANGSKAKSGTWTATAAATGTASFFRIKTSGGVCAMQGTCGTVGTDMILDNTSIAQNQTVTVTAFTLNENAHATYP